MVFRKAEGALTSEESKIIKALLLKGWRNQDIQALVNIGRCATINSARITEIKQDASILPASTADVEFYETSKANFDMQTGLNLYNDERLIRSRESMLLAVQVFNSPSLKFKTEIFAILANVSWTYLLHEYYLRKGVKIIQDDGRSLLLSKMLKRDDCPLSQGIKDNLESIKKIRDAVEHTLFRKSDLKWLSIFQACCLNFEKSICDLFGEKLTLQNELSFALQFAKMDFDQLSELNKHDIPATIEALDGQLEKDLGVDRLSDLEYRFKVVYTIENSTKSKAHVQFLHPSDEDAEEIRNVLIKNISTDKSHPHKAGKAVVEIQNKSGKKFTTHNHVQAWRKFDVRPRPGVKQPDNTKKEWCIFHPAHNDYTYSEKWINFVVGYIANNDNFEELKRFKTN
ncbi:MAG: DUF3644 domain-containing protein [Paracoccaceae bacterium]